MKLNPQILKESIAKGMLEKVFDSLKLYLQQENEDEKFNTLILMDSRLNTLNQKLYGGLIELDYYEREKRLLSFHIINFIDEINHDSLRKKKIKSPKKQNIEVELILKGRLEDFTKDKQLLLQRTIAAITNKESNDVKIKIIYEGSIKIILEIDKESSMLLLSKLKNDDVINTLFQEEFKLIGINILGPLESSPIFFGEDFEIKIIKIISKYEFIEYRINQNKFNTLMMIALVDFFKSISELNKLILEHTNSKTLQKNFKLYDQLIQNFIKVPGSRIDFRQFELFGEYLQILRSLTKKHLLNNKAVDNSRDLMIVKEQIIKKIEPKIIKINAILREAA